MNNIYKHYKGGKYILLNTATHSETKERLVVYKSLTDNQVWCRPERDFFEILPHGKPRFEKEEHNMDLHAIENARMNITSIIGMNLAESK